MNIVKERTDTERTDTERTDTEPAVRDAVMLTTADNPYDPFTQFDCWYSFDVTHGYNSCSLLGRLARTSGNLSDADNALEIRCVIDEIIRNDPTLMFRKAVPKT